MEPLGFVAAFALLVTLLFAVDVVRNRHPLDAEEIEALARKRQRKAGVRLFAFSTAPLPADPADKRAMRGAGEFVWCDAPFWQTPAWIAGLLKYKKHEWVVIAFVSACRVRLLWWNKGPDGTRVWSLLDDHTLVRLVRQLDADAVAWFHNHPNPDPRLYWMLAPSDADLESAASRAAMLDELGVSLLDFVCERGVPHLYFARVGELTVPTRPIVREIERANGRSVFRNWLLRRGLRRRTAADRIPAGTG